VHRLARALRLLTSAGHAHVPIDAIAYEAGFGDLANFNRVFRRRYGASPSLLRNDTLAGRATRDEPRAEGLASRRQSSAR
jgi:AraC-like DNA-binding protein